MLALVAFPVLAILTLWLLSRWASLKALPAYVTLPLFVSFFIPISTVALVPFDLVDDQTLDNKARLLMWRAIYWLSFVLMWFLLPVLQSYVESGYHDPLARLKDALHHTLRYHLVMLAAGIAGGIYMGISTGLSFTNLKALLIALSHSYGLVLVIWLLGHGLVNIPRYEWFGSVPDRLSGLYRRATHVHDSYADAQSSYDDVVAKIMALEPIKTQRYADWIDSLVLDIRSQDLPLSRTSSSRAQPRDLTPSNVADLARRLYREQSRAIRCRAEWAKLLKDVEYYEELRSSETVYNKSVRPVLVRVYAVVLGTMSGIVAWSELVSGTRLSLVDVIIRKAPPGFLQLLAAVFVLGYMCVCVTTSLTSMRIFNLYAIVPKHTDASSLLFFAAYALRITVPLSYNFLMLSSTQETVFQEFLGRFINLTALGKYFNELLPRLIVIPMILTVFNFYEIVKDYLGFGLGLDYFGDDDPEMASGSLLAAESEGRELVRRSLQGFSTVAGGGGFSASRAPAAAADAEDAGLLGTVRSWLSI